MVGTSDSAPIVASGIALLNDLLIRARTASVSGRIIRRRLKELHEIDRLLRARDLILHDSDYWQLTIGVFTMAETSRKQLLNKIPNNS